MKQKKLLLMFFIVIAFFVGIKGASSLEYKLFESSNNPITCKYVAITDDDIKLTITYDNGNFSAFYGDDTSGIKFEDAKIGFKDMSSKNSCPGKIDVELDDPTSVLEVIPKYTKVHCGSGEGKVTGIPKKIPKLTSLAVTIIQIAVPVILVLLGTLDLFKGMSSGKEDEMKKNQQMFVKRLVVGALIFFVIVIVKFFVSIVADTNVSNIVSCIDCFVDNSCLEGYE